MIESRQRSGIARLRVESDTHVVWGASIDAEHVHTHTTPHARVARILDAAQTDDARGRAAPLGSVRVAQPSGSLESSLSILLPFASSTDAA